MVNKDRVVPVQRIDLLTLFGTMLAIANVSYSVLAASAVEGIFSVTGSGAAGNKLANQPVKTLDFASGVTSGTVYFVAGFDFAGFTVNGAAATLADGSLTYDELSKDAATLYKAVLGSSKVTITAVSPAI